ncbi:MAG: hypothetical protein M1813_001976 [Trichoglossum hirsutum]|nr:MAG: hypothetical protein M1813_001976 [Trichoglossum hirsutum]
MKFIASVIVAMLAPLALGQSLADIPNCAQGCVTNSLTSTGCSTIDIKCICSANTFISNISCCIKTSCSTGDQAKTIKFASDICASVGVTTPTDINAACAAASGSSSISAPQSSASSASSLASSVGTIAGTVSTSKPTGSITLEATAKPTTGTGAAAPQFVGSGLGLVGAAVAALALL